MHQSRAQNDAEAPNGLEGSGGAEGCGRLDGIKSAVHAMDEDTLVKFQTELQYAVKYHEHAYNAAQYCILASHEAEYAAQVGAFAGNHYHPLRVNEVRDSPLYAYAREALSKLSGQALGERWSGWVCFESVEAVKEINAALENILRRRYPQNGIVYKPEIKAEADRRADEAVAKLGVKGIFLEGDLLESFETHYMTKAG